VRILVLNSAYAFPEWHPHDKNRMLRFKQKYRFWGCLDLETEALTRNGWKKYNEINVGDELLTFDPVTDRSTWQAATAVNVYDYSGEMVKWSGRVDALTTPNHRWVGEVQRGRNDTLRYERQTVHSEFVRDVRTGSRIVTGGGTPLGFRATAKWSDELVESVAWYVCDGSDHVNKTGFHSVHLAGKKPHKVAAWRRLAEHWTAEGATWREGKTRANGQSSFYLGKGVVGALQEAAPRKAITPEFLTSLTYAQAVLFHETLMAADGHVSRSRWTQVDVARRDAYQMLCAMLGIRSNQHDENKVQEYDSRYSSTKYLNEERVQYDGQVWCPTVPAGHFMARRNGVTYWTGNTTREGTRTVMTFTELITDDWIEEYLNDELIDRRPNPLGVIPVVHITNTMVSGSAWGLSDIADITILNREYNEKATDVSEIVNYHCVDADTEILTDRGWLRHGDLTTADRALGLDPDTDEIVWSDVQEVNRFDYDGDLVQWDNHVDALTTSGHRWLVDRRYGRAKHYMRGFATTDEVQSLTQSSHVIVGGGVPTHFPTEQKYTDEFVETVGWWVTEGCIAIAKSGTWHGTLAQSAKVNAPYVEDIRRLAAYWREGGHKFTERPTQTSSGCVTWYLGRSVVDALDEAGVDKQITPEFLSALTYNQALRLRQVLLAADGTAHRGRDIWYQDDTDRVDAFQMLSAMLGLRTRAFTNNRGDGVVDTYRRRALLAEHTTATPVRYTGTVWCPTTSTGTWLARRNGSVFWTGNSAPVTIVKGAKASSLERGPNKMWGGLPKDSEVYNLELSGGGVAAGLSYMEMLKKAMHELTGVPEGSLGDVQPISNTTGVALAIQYQPMMNRYNHKKMTYGRGLKEVNRLVLLTLAVKEPDSLMWNPQRDDELQEGQIPYLDVNDPDSFETSTQWPPPLPIDKLSVLNEIQLKMGIGLMSKKDALEELGEVFPDEKMRETFLELVQDAIDQGALSLLQAQISAFIQEETGQLGGATAPLDDSGDGDLGGDPAAGPAPGVTSAGGAMVNTASRAPTPEMSAIAAKIQQRAYGTALSIGRPVGSDVNNSDEDK
jgi:hypothetical protein